MLEKTVHEPGGSLSPSPVTDKILWSKAGGVGTLVFNNVPRHNAVSLEMWEAAAQLLEQFATDAEIRVVMLAGAGQKAFVSGADISKFETERATREAVEAYSAISERVYDLIYHFNKPTIAKVRGYCLGGGLGLAVSCDVRICSEETRIGIPAAKLGNGYAYSNVKRLVDLVGPAFAKEIFLTARQFGAREAYEKGLISQIVSSDELDSFVQRYVQDIASNAPLSVSAARHAILQSVTDEAHRDLEGCQDLIRRCAASQDYIEGRRAFMEKRKPNFTGS